MLPYTIYKEDLKVFDIPPLNQLLTYKVILTTAMHGTRIIESFNH
jgi:hypothetical protein